MLELSASAATAEITTATAYKVCSRCNQAKPLSDFYTRKAGSGKNREGAPLHRCIPCIKIDWREAARKRSPERRRLFNLRRNLRKQYGLELEAFEAISRQQGGRCAICLRTPQEAGQRVQRLYVDHSHSTGKVRGLLCAMCNVLLGQAGEDILRLESMIRYLKDRG